MKIIIIGAGELGQLLAARLSAASNDVVIIDTIQTDFQRVRDKLDVMTVHGDAVDIPVIKRAGIDHADMLIAVSGSQASNILACQIASHLGVRKTICRIYSADAFSAEDGITPGFFGIGKAFSSPAECMRHVSNVLRHELLLDEVEFSNPEATMVTIRIPGRSPLCGMRLQDIPDTELISHVRFAALVRDRQLKFPHGDTTLMQGDKVYVAGRRDYVERLVNYVSPGDDTNRKLLLIGGATILGKLIAKEALAAGMDIRVIEPDHGHCDWFLEDMPPTIKVINGETTDDDTLKEAGAAGCDVFVDTEPDDENNILSCILAKRLGARKVVSVTQKPEYISIVPEMHAIDCGFNSTLVSVNTVFRLMDTGTYRIDSQLEAFQAYVTEFRIQPTSRLVGKEIRAAKLPRNVVLAIIIRGADVLAPAGMTVLNSGDAVVAIVTAESEEQLKPYFA